MKVIGVGFGRTATMSLKHALPELGAGPCFHMIDLIMGEHRERDLANWTRIAAGERPDWNEVFDGYESTVDWPACSLWEELIEAFPDAAVLLNVRDFDGWYASCRNTILAAKLAAQAGEIPEDANRPAPPPELWGVIERLVWQGPDLEGRFEDEAWTRAMYERRIEVIRSVVPAKRLTVWEPGDGWEPLAAMLGAPAPDTPFPRLHDTNEFRTEMGLAPLPA